MLTWALVGSVAVLVLSPGLELLTGNPLYYVLVVTSVFLLLWAITRLKPGEVGYRPGDSVGYRIAVLHPLLVMGGLVLVATLAGATRPTDTPARDVVWQITIMSIVTIVGVLITEEGFFRGWLWGTLDRAGLSDPASLLWTSAVFTAWHFPVVIIEADFALPVHQIPTYLANVLLLGMCWGAMRMATGSIVVASVSHGLWNGLAYVLFGYGQTSGALGIADSAAYDPERGVWGIAFNFLAFLLLWRWWVGRLPSSQSPAP
jgi:membrane protease YdiL (CAAX protease family)